MHTLETEYQQLNAAGELGEAATLRAIAIDRGNIFSLYAELRFALYAAVASITTGIGILLKNNVDRIGPVTLIITLLFFALLCYASAERTRRRGAERSIGGDYVLLLGGLILSADLAYAESRFHWLGNHWSWHLLLLAALHSAAAYYFNSRLMLSAALTSLASWFGVQPQLDKLFTFDNALRESSTQALLCAGTLVAWREVHRRTARQQPFVEVLEHFAANIAFWGALALSFDNLTHWIGILLVIALSVISIGVGLYRRQEAFVVYGITYSTLGLCVFEAHFITIDIFSVSMELLTIVVAAISLWRFHSQLKAQSKIAPQ